MEKVDQNSAVPTYSRVIDNSAEYVAPQAQQQPVAEQPPAPAQEAPAGQEQTPVPGGAQEQQAPAGTEQPAGQETPSYIQDIQMQLAALNQQMAGQGQGDQGDPMVQLEQQLVDLQAKAESGEITYSEMIRATAPLIEQRATMKVKQDLQQEEEAKQIRGAQDAFLAENPDFKEFVASPEAQAIRQANPVLDNVSAYYAFKAKSAEAAIGNLQQQFNELKAQMESSIKGAAKEQASVVGTGSGENSPVPQLGKGDGLKPFEGGLAALRRARTEQ
ncbi:hypothetical protein LLG39_08845 [bacterium]|nr:hypothetical protein [bacterium]